MNENILFVKFSELKDRLDPSFYLPIYKELEEKLKNSNFTLKKLGEICDINRGGSPRPIQEYLTANNDGVNWIKIGDTKNINKYIYKTKQKIKSSGIRHSRMVKVGDFILSNSMSFGKPYIMKTTGCIHDGWLLLRKKDNSISESFLYTILSTDLIFQFFKRLTIGGVVENLSIELVKKVRIPVPNINIQAKIVNKVDDAIQAKEQKEKEAQTKLDSIDEYLLKELGIQLPLNEKESLGDRIFLRKFSEISGSRIDPFYNNLYYAKIDKEMENGKFSIKPMKELCYGVSGVIYSGSDERKQGKSILRGNNITLKTNEINFDSIRYIRDDINISDNLLLKSDDIFMSSASGSKEHVGKVAYIENNLNHYFGGFMMVLRQLSDDYLQKYLFEFLQSRIFREYLFKNLGGTNINNLNYNMLSNLKIPLPPIETQNKIVAHIQQLRNEARILKKEATKTYKETKKEVEQMILNGE